MYSTALPALLLASCASPVQASPFRQRSHPMSLAAKDWGNTSSGFRWKKLYEQDTKLWSAPNTRSPEALKSAMPYTLLYVLETAPSELLEVPEDLHIHVLGATYTCEGRADWNYFMQLLQQKFPQVKTLHVLLDMVHPFFADQQAAVRQQDSIKQVEYSKVDQPLKSEGKWHKSDMCYDDDNTGVHVKCVLGFYQDILKKEPSLPQPHLVVMVNPGLGQPARRSWDPVIRHVLRRRIPFVVSSMVVQDGRARPRELAGAPTQPLERAEEDFQCAVTLKAYGANLIQATISPFPLIHDGRHDDPPEPIIWKNAVLTVYKGFTPGRKMCRPQQLSSDQQEWLKQNKASEQLTNLFDAIDGDWTADVRRPACRAYDYAFRDVLLKRGGLEHITRKSKKARAIVDRLQNSPTAYVKIFDLDALLRAGMAW